MCSGGTLKWLEIAAINSREKGSGYLFTSAAAATIAAWTLSSGAWWLSLLEILYVVISVRGAGR